VKKSILPNSLHISYLEPEQKEDFPFDVDDHGEMILKKPVIYLYPKTKSDVRVELDYQ